MKRSLVLAPVLEKVAHLEAVWFTRATRSLSGTIPRTYIGRTHIRKGYPIEGSTRSNKRKAKMTLSQEPKRNRVPLLVFDPV